MIAEHKWPNVPVTDAALGNFRAAFSHEYVLIGNQEVAYDRFNRKDHVHPRADRQGMARGFRSPRIRDLSKVDLDQPFVAGERSTGKMTYPGFEGYPWLAWVTAVEAPNRLAIEWTRAGHPRRSRDRRAPWSSSASSPKATGPGCKSSNRASMRFPSRFERARRDPTPKAGRSRSTMSAAMPKAEPAVLFAALGDLTRIDLLDRLGNGAAVDCQPYSWECRFRAGADQASARARARRSRLGDPRRKRDALPGSTRRPAAARAWTRTVSAQWDSAIDRLKRHVED